MRVSLRWLKEYVAVSLPPQELAHRLTMSGNEVESITDIGAASGRWDKICVGQVAALRRHPNADRLLLCDVDSGTERITVVTGAPNLRQGQKVPFARVGATLIDGHSGEPIVLRRAQIRGIASEGMVCSEKELGLSEDHSGIMVLPDDAPVGVPLAQYLGDTIFDLKVTPNRPDCLSVIGIAREVAALTGETMHLPDISYEELGPPIEDEVAVEIWDPDLCGRYCCSLVRGVSVGPSPAWMQERLLASGMRPIDNIVDITNYVMLEFGQPLHAFDFATLRGRRVIVRRARPGEVLTTLDGVERILSPDMLLIADAEGAIAIAGVMGGAETEVAVGTTTVLLESANFHQANIRRTSRQLRLQSEASSRFEKGLPPELTVPALRRASQLMAQLTGGRPAPGIIDSYPGQQDRQPILLTKKHFKRLLGVAMDWDEIRQPLEALGFVCQDAVGSEGETAISVMVPYWRRDVTMAEDLVEEVARIIGYDALPTTLPLGRLPEPRPDPLRELQRRVRQVIAGCGFQEVITHSLVSLAVLQQALPGEALDPPPIRVANPISSEQEYLRTSLRPGLLMTLARNQRHEEGSLRFFEVSRTYIPRPGQLPEEREVLAGIASGPRQETSWLGDSGEMGFFDAKGILETLFARLGVAVAFEPWDDDRTLQPGRTARVMAGDAPLGVLGEVRPSVAESFDLLPHPVVLFEVELAPLVPLLGSVGRYQPLPRFPAVLRDLALVVDGATPAHRVEEILCSSPLVANITLFDVYRGDQVPVGKKSLAFRVVYRVDDRTLTDAEVNEVQEQILERLRRELGATLRGPS